VALIQIDGKWKNLALMKLATWHKERGDDITYIDLSGYNFDRVYGSKIFMGGSGYDVKAKLPENIEEVIPDYELFNFSEGERIGFTSRGCIRNCEFCIVREKEGYIKEEKLDWLLKASKVILIDNNFLASPKWKEKLEFFIKHKMKVCITQALDIRLVNEENAKLIGKVKWYNHRFTGRTLYFAFDDPKLMKVVDRGIDTLIKSGVKAYWLMFYVLVGYNTTIEKDLERIYFLRSKKVKPFVMIYNNRKDDVQLRDLARWCNLNYYKVIDFDKYKPNRKRFGKY